MKRLIMCLPLVFASCTSLHTRVHESIHRGDNSNSVRDVLGTPEAFEDHGESELWIYSQNSSGDTCAVEIDKTRDSVMGMACKRGSSAAARFFQGFSQGMQASPRPVNCRPNGLGGFVCQ